MDRLSDEEIEELRRQKAELAEWAAKLRELQAELEQREGSDRDTQQE